ncbi:MAG: hypothetical protein FWE04_05295 [Oscillospiraceae bacterium]|nr:hypothetical protein [Oscillospiraceae bacterium]
MFNTQTRKLFSVLIAFTMLFSLAGGIAVFADSENDGDVQTTESVVSSDISSEDGGETSNVIADASETDTDAPEEGEETSEKDLNLDDDDEEADIPPTEDGSPEADIDEDSEDGIDDETEEIDMLMSLFALASGTSWDLSDFITGANMYDISDSANPVLINPGDPTYIGDTYKFVLDFAETPSLQLEYTNSNPPYPDGVLVYQLPAALNIQNAVAETPIRIANNAIVGWYTIDTSGLVLVWFNDVDQNGNPSDYNYIDFTNVTIRLEIFAQLTDSGSGLDFGGGNVIEISPEYPPPSLGVHKDSRYDPAAGIIYYMITITALGVPGGDPVTNITLADAPTINGQSIVNDHVNSNAFSAFTYTVNQVGMPPGTLTPMSVNWLDDPAVFSYDFAESLNPGDFITIRYNLNINTLIINNPTLVPSTLNYNFSIGNQVSVTSPDISGTVIDTTTDPVSKVFPISKSAVLVPPVNTGDSYQIQWTITVGDGALTRLNGGTITDTLGPNLFLPTADQIDISLYAQNNSTPVVSDNLLNLSGDLNPSFDSGTGAAPYTTFELTIPDPYTNGDIYQAVIVFYTDINPPPRPGMPAVIYTNYVEYNDGHMDIGTTGKLPLTPAGPAILTKTTSGICGRPEIGYFIDYTITLNVPAGLLGQPLYLFDTLGMMPSGAYIPNVPQNFIITAIDPATGVAPVVPLVYSGPTPYYQLGGNSWSVFFGTSVGTDPSQAFWQYNREMQLIITYQIQLDAATVIGLQSNANNMVQNTAYLINSVGVPQIASNLPNYNVVGAQNMNDYWPIFKTAIATANPSLFNYTVSIKGGYSLSPNPLFMSGSTPIFTDTFDDRLEYVAGSFYMVNTSSNPVRYFAPITDVTVNGNEFSVVLSDLYEFTAPPLAGGAQIGTAPPVDWFAVKNNFEAHYQLHLLDAELALAQPNLVNTVSIEVNPGECMFENGTQVNYSPNPLAKTMTPVSTGSNMINVEIIINPTGGVMFAPDSSGVGPAEITAKDELTNLMLYLDTITIYTQTEVNGIWDGIWTQQAITFNSGDVWSVNVVSESEVDFILPNEQPIRIVYTALVTTPAGQTGQISNKISIFGDQSDAGNDQYTVDDSQVGAGASVVDLRVFKQGPSPTDRSATVNLGGAVFNLYVADVTDPTNYQAPGNLDVAFPVTGTDGVVRDFYLLLEDVTTDSDGMALFEDNWITGSYKFLFLLVETGAPNGYVLPDGDSAYTYFTINPQIPGTEIIYHEDVLGNTINPISDFITIQNELYDPRGSLTITKAFENLPNGINVFNFVSQITFLVVGTGSDGSEVYNETIALQGGNFTWNPNTSRYEITLTDLPLGSYRVYESGGNAVGYIFNRPTVPELAEIAADGDNVIVNFVNSYTFVPPPPVPTLVIHKVFHGLAHDNLPREFFIRITGPSNFDETLNLDEAISGKNFIGLEFGEYTVEEFNFNVPGFRVLEVLINNERLTLPHKFSITANNPHIFINIDNFYIPTKEPLGSLTITKEFEGLPVGINVFNFVSQITFLVVGEDSAGHEIYSEEVKLQGGNFVWNPLKGRYEIILINLPLGHYKVYEHGGDAVRYILDRPNVPELASVTVPSRHGIVHFINSYAEVPPPQQVGSLTVRKVFDGLTQAQIPQNFELVVRGPDNFEKIIRLAEALEGVRIDDLVVGSYTITERNSQVAGFNMTVNPALPYTVNVTVDSDIEVIITNVYRIPPTPPVPQPIPPRPITPTRPPVYPPPINPPPTHPPTHPPIYPPVEPPIYPPIEPPYPPVELPYPPDIIEPPDIENPTVPTEPTEPGEPPQAPQTGDQRQTTIFIILLIAGIVVISSAVVYGKRKKLFR